MQLINLPRGGQKGIKGPAVNVPTSLDSVVSMLPRLPSQCGIVPVKLKRKLCYKGHVLYQSIRPGSVMNALEYLTNHNIKYKDVAINKTWVDEAYDDNQALTTSLIQGCKGKQRDKNKDGIASSSDEEINITKGDNEDSLSKSQDEGDIKKDSLYKDCSDDEVESKLRGMTYNTCLQPSSALNTGREVFSVAPGEGQHPISFFNDPDCETLAFPVLFPTGKFGLSANRSVHLSMRRYFNQRLLHADNRFAQNTEYLFFAQYICEARQISDNISIAMRKGSGLKSLTAGYLRNADNMEAALKQNEGFRFLQTVRGSYPYWLKTLHDLNAMVRQLDIPTWFCSFSAADLKWPETIQVIAQQQGQVLSDEDILNMDWQRKCLWIRSNPVTAARHFEFRVNRFLRDVLMSPAAPLGKITDYFIRTEFQQRGSPHIHCLFWVEGAPKIGQSLDEDVSNFINKYISAQLPSEEDDEELYTLVSSLQRHCHSTTCKTSKKKCRFNFPRPPSGQTVLAAPCNADSFDMATLKKRRKDQCAVLQKVQQAVNDNPERTLDILLQDIDIDKESYYQALKESVSNPTIIHQRSPSDTCINNYNADLLKVWSANLDIQFVTNAYACAMYILSYVSKGERQMGELLKAAARECQGDDTIRQQLRKLGNVFLSHRELSAQEAVYRIISLPLKRCSRAVVFVNSGLPDDRIRILKASWKLQTLPADSDEIFENGIIDRYIARPDSLNEICLADFATSYRSKASQSEGGNNTEYADEDEKMETDIRNKVKGKEITLKNSLGVMTKRMFRAILRSPRFSRTKFQEAHYHSKLMLYYPWRKEITDLLGNCETYERFYDTVKETVAMNMKLFENNTEELDFALEKVGSLPENVWDELASGQQQSKYEEQKEQKPSEDLEAHEFLNDFTGLSEMGGSAVTKFSVEIETKMMSTKEYQENVRSLNSMQKKLFESILCWCRRQVRAKKMEKEEKPFYTFLTGGAGTGKSHLVKTIVNMVKRELRPICDSPDETTVLITAPTGIAALNIDGVTIHHALSIPAQLKNDEYPPFPHKKLAAARRSLEHLCLLIIDEVSMVSLKTLILVHKRLQDIRGIDSIERIFGGYSVLAVGDFYQLEPVMQRPVYELPSDGYQMLNPFHIWRDYFRIFELTEVMRQKSDIDFASLLNRVRVGSLSNEDIDVLKSRIISQEDDRYPHDALHVFTTNSLVNEHNMRMLGTIDEQPKVLIAFDSKKDLHTNKASITNIPDDISLTGGLHSSITLAVGAKVMLTRNLDVSDGLVNGAQGTVVGFRHESNNSKEPVVEVFVKFFSPAIGQQYMKKYPCCMPGAVSITRQESSFFLHKRGAIQVSRKQFPLKLSFASTVHKVQGLSLENVVVSFQHSFHAGQAYVALSRAKSLQGLHLQSFDALKIKTSEKVQKEMERLKINMSFQQKPEPLALSHANWTKICHINARGLLQHKEDLLTYENLTSCDIICISETWLSSRIPSQLVDIPHFKFIRRDRQDSFKMHNCSEKCSKCNDKGGVGIYIRNSIQSTVLHYFLEDGVECLFVELVKGMDKLYICVVYRPEHVNLEIVSTCLKTFVSEIHQKGTVVILGDFNFDFKITHTCISKTMLEYGFIQIISSPTHLSGSTIDHIYINQRSPMLQHGVIPCYFSDHSATYCIIPTPGDDEELNRVISPPPQVINSSKKTEEMPKKAQHVYKFTRQRTSNVLESSRMKTKSKDVNEVTDDVIELRNEENEIYMFNFILPSQEDTRVFLDFWQIPGKQHTPVRNTNYDVRYRGYLQTLQQHTCPCIIDATEPDGNCFFRAISKQLLRTESFHHRIRQAICNFEENHMCTFVGWLGTGLDGLKQHIATMRRSRKWATEVELLATATYFDTTLNEFTEQYPAGNDNWKWIQIKPVPIHPADPPYDGIPIEGQFYLHHTLGVHFDCVFPDESVMTQHSQQ